VVTVYDIREIAGLVDPVSVENDWDLEFIPPLPRARVLLPYRCEGL